MCVGVLMCMWEISQFLLQCIHPTPAVTTYVGNERSDSLNIFMLQDFEQAKPVANKLRHHDLQGLFYQLLKHLQAAKCGNIVK